MKKDAFRWVVGIGVLLVLYILITFLVPFVHTAIFWVSFIFTLIAFAVVAASFYIAFIKNPDAKSHFYGFPIAKIGAIYGLVQLIAGILFMVLAAYVPVWAVILVYAIALGAAVIGLISAEAVVSEIQVQDAKLKKDISLMRALQSKVNQIAVQSENASIKALADEFRYSDPVSNDAMAEAEADLVSAVDELQSAVVDGDTAVSEQLCRKVSALLAERNRICKLNKH